MNALRKLAQNLSTLNLPQILAETLDGYDEQITDAIKGQLLSGKRGDGTNMPKYSQRTRLIKQEKGQAIIPERIALIDTGDFWKSIFSTPYESLIKIDAKDWKRDELVQRYGEAIFQLSPESWKTIYKAAEAEFKTRVYQWLNQ